MKGCPDHPGSGCFIMHTITSLVTYRNKHYVRSSHQRYFLSVPVDMVYMGYVCSQVITYVHMGIGVV